MLEAAAAARPDILIIDLGCEITLGLIAEVRRRVVSVEAGLGLDQAIQSVTRELGLTHPELCEELSLVTLEMRDGKRRADALRNLSDRTGQADLRQLVAILVQSDRFGTSMAESLRTHADFMRIQRRQEAEERANKRRREVGVPDLLLHSAVHVYRDGGSGARKGI